MAASTSGDIDEVASSRSNKRLGRSKARASMSICFVPADKLFPPSSTTSSLARCESPTWVRALVTAASPNCSKGSKLLPTVPEKMTGSWRHRQQESCAAEAPKRRWDRASVEAACLSANREGSPQSADP